MHKRKLLNRERPKTHFYKQLISGEEARNRNIIEPVMKFDSNNMFMKSGPHFKNDFM